MILGFHIGFQRESLTIRVEHRVPQVFILFVILQLQFFEFFDVIGALRVLTSRVHAVVGLDAFLHTQETPDAGIRNRNVRIQSRARLREHHYVIDTNPQFVWISFSVKHSGRLPDELFSAIPSSTLVAEARNSSRSCSGRISIHSNALFD